MRAAWVQIPLSPPIHMGGHLPSHLYYFMDEMWDLNGLVSEWIASGDPEPCPWPGPQSGSNPTLAHIFPSGVRYARSLLTGIFYLAHDVCVWYSSVMKIFMYTQHILNRPKTKAETIVRIILGVVIFCFTFLLLLVSITGFLYAHSAVPALIAFGTALLLYALGSSLFKELSRSYIEVSDQDILVVTYGFPFGIRHEKHIKKQDIVQADISRSKRIHGRLAGAIPLCIILYDDSDLFLFEVCYCKESLECFRAFLQDKALPPLP